MNLMTYTVGANYMQIDLSGKYWFFVGVMWIFFGGGIAHLALVDPKLWLGTMAWIVSATMAAGGAALCWVARKGRSMKNIVVFCVLFFVCFFVVVVQMQNHHWTWSLSI